MLTKMIIPIIWSYTCLSENERLFLLLLKWARQSLHENNPERSCSELQEDKENIWDINFRMQRLSKICFSATLITLEWHQSSFIGRSPIHSDIIFSYAYILGNLAHFHLFEQINTDPASLKKKKEGGGEENPIALSNRPTDNGVLLPWQLHCSHRHPFGRSDSNIRCSCCCCCCT